MTQNIKIPEGYKLVQKNEQEYEIVPLVDFSILNDKDWFKIKIKPNRTVFSKGDIFNDCKSWFTNTDDIYNSRPLVSDRSDFISIEKATEEEIEKIYERVPKWREKPEWEDFGKLKGYWVNANSEIRYTHIPSREDHKNVWPTKAEAEACLALSQLCQWRNRYNEEWKPNWNDCFEKKYTITFFDNTIHVSHSNCTHCILYFKTKEIRDRFLEDFRELIEIAKPLL